jgi:hypothetical protein
MEQSLSITREEAKKCVGNGWAKLLDEIYDQLPADVYVCQVKEKFGGLRFYVGSAPIEVLDFIEQAETKSYKICEECGEVGRERSMYTWIYVRCDKCWEALIERRLKEREEENAKIPKP